MDRGFCCSKQPGKFLRWTTIGNDNSLAQIRLIHQFKAYKLTMAHLLRCNLGLWRMTGLRPPHGGIGSGNRGGVGSGRGAGVGPGWGGCRRKFAGAETCSVILEKQPLALCCLGGVSFELTDRGCVASIITLTPRRDPHRAPQPESKGLPGPHIFFRYPQPLVGTRRMGAKAKRWG